MISTGFYRLSVSVLLFSLSACQFKGGWITTLGPHYRPPVPATDNHWQASSYEGVVAHQGEITTLTKWWERFDDATLVRLITAAQQESASVASAKARIEQARANLVGSDALFLPNIDGSLSSSRSSFSFGQAPILRTQHQVNVQSSWEIDLFGGLARRQEAATRQLESRHAAWHDARVAIAVEVANAYVNYRYCEAQVQLMQTQVDSLAASKKLIHAASQAGFRSADDVTLSNASLADGNVILLKQQAQCERDLKGLVALTGVKEDQVRLLLGAAPDRIGYVPEPPFFKVNAIPANVIRQRPDIAVAERDMAEASANIGVKQADRFPRLNLSGNIAPVLQNMNGGAFSLAETWSIGPTLNLPLFDAGKREADVQAARAQYEATVSQYQSTVRQAIKEVEEAMVRLASVTERLPEADTAASDYHKHFQATQKLYEAGLGNLIDTESARRNVINAELAIKALQYEEVSAWIALYRAVGGSWQDQIDADQKNSDRNKAPVSNHLHQLSRESS